MSQGTDIPVEIRTVASRDWVSAAERARDQGWDRFDWLDATDDIGRADTVTVVCQLQDRSARQLRLRTSVPRREGSLPTLAGVFPGAGWAEREAAEGFAVQFAGGDPRRLLLGPDAPEAPLLKDHPLAARAAVPWPGADDPDEGARRRRMVPPGVPDPAVWGDRDPGAGPAAPEEIAASTAGGRVRRAAGTAREAGGRGRASRGPASRDSGGGTR